VKGKKLTFEYRVSEVGTGREPAGVPGRLIATQASAEYKVAQVHVQFASAVHKCNFYIYKIYNLSQGKYAVL
jgi:hypothetical protein